MSTPTPREMLAEMKRMLDEFGVPYELLPPPYPDGPPGFAFACGCGFRLEGERGEREYYTRCDDPDCPIAPQVEATAHEEAAAEGQPLQRKYMKPRGRPRRRSN